MMEQHSTTGCITATTPWTAPWQLSCFHRTFIAAAVCADTADALSTTSSLSWYAASSSARRTSSMSMDPQLQKQQHAVARLGSNLGSSARSSSGGLDACIGDEHVTGVTMLPGESQRRQGQLMSMQPAAGGGHCNAEVQCAPGTAAAGSSSSTPAPAGRCTTLQLDTVGLLAGTHRSVSAEAASAGNAAGQAGREALRLLVDLLLRQRGGRAYAVAQLDELDGSPAALPLQIEVSVLRFRRRLMVQLCLKRRQASRLWVFRSIHVLRQVDNKPGFAVASTTQLSTPAAMSPVPAGAQLHRVRV